jgi:hypothetical protein
LPFVSRYLTLAIKGQSRLEIIRAAGIIFKAQVNVREVLLPAFQGEPIRLA